MTTGPPQTERQADGRCPLLRDLGVAVDDETYVVPEKSTTDLSSISRFDRILLRSSKVDIAGVVRDYSYEEQPRTPYNRAEGRAAASGRSDDSAHVLHPFDPRRPSLASS